MREVVDKSGLPLRLVDEEDGFRFDHMEGGKLVVFSGQQPGRRNPTSFRCEAQAP